MTNPKLILTDNSLAIINACIKEFCNENLNEYLDRCKWIRFLEIFYTYTVCAFHMIRLNRKHASKHSGSGPDSRSRVYFAMLVFGRLINGGSLDEACNILNATIVLKSKYASNLVKESLQRLETSINTFRPIGQYEVDSDEVDSDIYNTTDDICGSNDDDIISDEASASAADKDQTRSSLTTMHAYWEKHLNKLKQTSDEAGCELLELNRYYMPGYCTWVHDKLPHIALWGNLCQGLMKNIQAKYFQ